MELSKAPRRMHEESLNSLIQKKKKLGFNCTWLVLWPRETVERYLAS